MRTSTPLLGVVNAGSSSLKFAIYDEDKRVISGLVDGIGLHPGVRAVGAARQALAVPDVFPSASRPQPVTPSPGHSNLQVPDGLAVPVGFIPETH